MLDSTVYMTAILDACRDRDGDALRDAARAVLRRRRCCCCCCPTTCTPTHKQPRRRQSSEL